MHKLNTNTELALSNRCYVPQNYVMIRTAFQTMHPFGQIVFFFCMVLMGMGIASGAGLALLAAFQGHSTAEAIAFAGDPNSYEGMIYNLAINALNQLISFGLMAWIASRIFAGRVFLQLKWPKRAWGWWAIGLAWAAQPVIDLTFRLNQWLLKFFPTAWIEAADRLEALAAEVTKSMLTFTEFWQFPSTLVIVAFLPALCEEFTFRGILQPLFAKWTNNIHAGIWASAFLFSAIHLQFHGFLPRMILGAGLGYLVVYSGSLWPAIIAHFFNNASAVLLAAILGEEWINQEINGVQPWEPMDYVLAAAAVALGGLGVRWIRHHAAWPSSHPVSS